MKETTTEEKQKESKTQMNKFIEITQKYITKEINRKNNQSKTPSYVSQAR